MNQITSNPIKQSDASVPPVRLLQVEALDAVKNQAQAALQESGFLPPAKAEMWRHFSVNALRSGDFAAAEQSDVADEKPSWFPEETIVLAFSNGFLKSDNENSASLPDGMSIDPMTADELQDLMTDKRVKSAENLPQVNIAQTQSAVKITLEKTITQPIILWHQHSQSEALIAPTVQINASDEVEATVMEIYNGGSGGLAIPMTHLSVSASANVEYIRWHDLDNKAAMLGVLSADVGDKATLNANVLNTSGTQVRLDAEVHISGEEADARLNGLSLLKDAQQLGLYYRVNHPEPDSVSSQKIRVVVDDKARHIYDGYIYVGHGANGTDAQQDSKSMLISKLAQAMANPRLEILTDDVSCAHGATVGFLDNDAMFYLRSRGISEARAQAMMIEGFAHAALTDISNEAIKQAIEAFIHERYVVTA